MSIKMFLAIFIALLTTILSLYALNLPSSSFATNVKSNLSQLVATKLPTHHNLQAKCDEIWKYSSKLAQVYKASLVFIVDLHGCGNFTKVQRAIDAVPENSPSKTLVVINSKIYREKVTVSKTKTNIVLQGRGYLNTFIEWHDNSRSANGTNESYSFAVYANNFRAHDISFRNTAPEPMPDVRGGQAVALWVGGDQAAFYECGFYSFQDTLLDDRGKHYFKSCLVQGSLDFLFGNGQSIYQDCTIRSVARETTSGINGYITAQGKELKDQKTGFSFINCTIDGTGKMLLGRAWRPYATVVFSHTYMPQIISAEGWSDWGNDTYDATVYYGEHRCYGAGANYTKRVSYAKQLTDSEASTFTDISFIDGDKWLNDNEILYKPNSEEHQEDLISSY